MTCLSHLLAACVLKPVNPVICLSYLQAILNLAWLSLLAGCRSQHHTISMGHCAILAKWDNSETVQIVSSQVHTILQSRTISEPHFCMNAKQYNFIITVNFSVGHLRIAQFK